MPNCCVPQCENSSTKGFILKCFPKNERRRIEWLKNINRLNWTPNHSHRVCETHFAPNMWEKTRVDGSRKLKFNAIPTIFGGHVIKESSAIQDMISDDSNKQNNETILKNDASLKNVLSNHQKLIRILPPSNSINVESAPSSVFGTQSISSTSAIIVNKQGKVVNSNLSRISGTTSILKPQIIMSKVQSSPMIISTNTSVLKKQLTVANSQTPILIPATTSILKSEVPTSNALTSRNLNSTSQVKAIYTQPALIPITTNIQPQCNLKISSKSAINSKESMTIKGKILNSKNSAADSEKSNYLNQQSVVSTQNSSGIILNKVQVKKMKDERFEKMDKLLLKQLKLNNALRRKLNIMNCKIQQLMKEQSTNYKEFLADVFTEDQIRALELRHTNPKSITPWSHKTMLKAMKLKQECGTRGYEELLNQNMPLPSIRTICRWCTQRNIPIP